MNNLSIGQVAKRADMSIDTIRYYERAGLVPAPMRKESGYRSYEPETVKRLRFIRRAKDLGFTLAEITELLDLSSQAQQDMAKMKSTAQARLSMIEDRIRELLRIRRALRGLVAACPGHGPLAECPIVDALNRDVS